jgi:hypothetical protein
MLEDLLKELLTLKDEVEKIDINQLPENQKASTINDITDKVITILNNAKIPLPEEHSDDSGTEVPTSEV